MEKMTLSITETARTLGISRTLAYNLANNGELPTIRLRGRLLVPVEALKNLLVVRAKPNTGNEEAVLECAK